MRRYFSRNVYAASLLLGFAGAAFAPSLQLAALAQSTISGDIAGAVTDNTGAAIPGAQVSITSKTTGQVRSVTTSGTGSYRASLLSPGAYSVVVTSQGFEKAALDINVEVGQVANGDIRLGVGQAHEVVTVTSATPLLKTDAADLTTTFDLQQIQAIPNPGNDLTYYAQTAPGVVMNTGGGLGNFSAFGLPGTSNNFLVNGAQQNDPFLNLNNSGPSNLLLGQNDISEVNVVTNAYGTEFGSFGGAQLNEITRAGTNALHGNATYYYNGSVFNANDWFNNNGGASRPNTVNNQWAFGIGGPIVKDKSFFFINTEGIRFVTTTTTDVFIPTPAYQNAVLNGNGVIRGINNGGGLVGGAVPPDPGTAGEAAYVQNILNLWNNSPATQAAVAQGRVQSAGGDANYFVSNPKLSLREGLVTARFDQAFGLNDKFFIHVLYDDGRQPTSVNPLYGQWAMNSSQPEYNGQLSETHSFGASSANQFLFTAAHYAALFSSVNYQAAQALLPYSLIPADEPFTPLNGNDFVFPQGRNATQYQFADDFSTTHGNHTIKIGGLFKRDDLSDFDMGFFNNPLTVDFMNFNQGAGTGSICDATTNPSAAPIYQGLCFYNGYQFENEQVFPGGTNQSCIGGACTGVPPSNPIGFYNMGIYLEDVWKTLPNLTVTVGIRFEHNSNPVSQNYSFGQLNASTGALISSHADTGDTPYRLLISGGHQSAFKSEQSMLPEPRLGINWQPFGPATHTVVSGGFGMFADVFPGTVVDSFLRNPIANTGYTSIVPYQGLQPGARTFSPDGFTANQNSNAVFFPGVANGITYNQAVGYTGGAFTAPNVTNPANSISYPTYEEYNIQVQQQIRNATSIQIGYVGNHGYHQPVIDGSKNAYNAGAPFTGLPSSAPLPSFSAVTDISSRATSNYNGFIASFIERQKYLTAQINYAFSHAMDEISNGGVLAFASESIVAPINPNRLSDNYGNADYDVRHNITGNYVINVPYLSGFQVAGTVFWHTGLPFTVIDGGTAGDFVNYGGVLPARGTTRISDRHCGSEGARGLCLDPDDFATATAFGQQQRNTFTGPGFFDTDISVLKDFKVPRFENYTFQLGAQLFNALNHPNFAQPLNNIADKGDGFGHIFSTVGSPTSIYGSGLGGDASVRILQFKAKFIF